ncbi:hypothetical protein LNV28_13835 [Paucibacter sp. DJ2R-2]|nr:hypothetical protein [Paucibacter sp. DJ2R-2]MCV2422008.1 hypothetical protein [Paucibacter sp. DJ4R-1]MCV2439375.1 hypothetical protein [Paucibacter sp. DJ2R-2]
MHREQQTQAAIASRHAEVQPVRSTTIGTGPQACVVSTHIVLASDHIHRGKKGIGAVQGRAWASHDFNAVYGAHGHQSRTEEIGRIGPKGLWLAVDHQFDLTIPGSLATKQASYAKVLKPLGIDPIQARHAGQSIGHRAITPGLDLLAADH